MSWNRSLSVLIVAVLALAPFAHATDPDRITAPPAQVTLIATDFGFEAPATMPAGAITIRFVNNGAEVHHAQLLQLKDGKTPADLGAAFENHQMPDFVDWAGGPGVVVPGQETSVTLYLRPGTYYWFCFVPSPGDQMPHAMKGMMMQVTVEAVEGRNPAELPPADNTIMLSDYDFQWGRPFVAGHQTIRVRNYAAQPHEMLLFKLMPGKTAQDIGPWLMAGGVGEPVAMPLGGLQAIDNGVAANFDVTLEPGEYALLCFIPDAKDMQPHIAHGMAKQFTVQ